MDERFYFVVDTETGGLMDQDPSLLTVDGILTDSKLEVIDRISLKLKPDDGVYRVNAIAMGINGIDLVEHGKEAVSLTEGSDRLAEFFRKHVGLEAHLYHGDTYQQAVIPVGQFLSFDMHFMKAHLPMRESEQKIDYVKYDWHRYLARRGLCTAAVSQFLVMQGKLPHVMDSSLKSLAAHFGYDYSGAHNSAFDAELTRKVLKGLLAL